MGLLPDNATRVEQNTAAAVNNKIARETHQRVRRFRQDAGAIDRRLRELDAEWDTERALETSAAGFTLLGFSLGYLVNPAWHWFSAVIAAFLLLHALQGWCPPLPLIRRLGIRTAAEINRERMALLRLAEDFGPPSEPRSGNWLH